MLFTYIHSKEYRNASWHVAHLYEHLVTYSFQKHLESLGIHPGFIGNISGDTFEHVIFLHAIFYDKRIADAYEHFLKTPLGFDEMSITHILNELEVEEQEVFSLKSKLELNAQLNSLIASPWSNNSKLKSYEIDESLIQPEAPFSIKESAKEFRDIVVGLYVNTDDLNVKEQTLFLRLSAIMNDVICYALRGEQSGSYHIGLSPISKSSDIMGSIQHVRFQRSMPLKEIKEIAEKALQDIDIQAVMSLIAAHFDEFGSHASWKSFIVNYYKHTGIITSNEYIASLATPERAVSIISKSKIHVRTMQKDDEEWFPGLIDR